jgi:Pentapeptide repeats (8 copies)
MSILGAVVIILFLVGAFLFWTAWEKANNAGNPVDSSRAQLMGGLAIGVLTGALAAFAVLLLQLQLSAIQEEAVWRANVSTAAEIPGFAPAGHSLLGLNLSGKRFPGANLSQANLTDVQMRGTQLQGADLTKADLHGAVMYSADLSTADLTGADLSDAQLQGVRFDRASVEHARSFVGAVANVTTCWPSGFLELPIAKEIRAVYWDNGRGHLIKSKGHEYPNCIRG